MTSVAAHPATTIAREAVRAMRPTGLRRPQARGPLATPFDPFAATTIADPAAAYGRLHADPGVHPMPARGSYALAAYDDVRAATRAHDALVSGGGVTLVPAALPMLLTLDRPRHTQLRRLLASHFTSQRAAASAPVMHAVVGRAVDGMLARPGADAVAELAVPLPITVIAQLLAVPRADIGLLHRWSDDIVEGFHAGSSVASTWRALRSVSAVLALHRYMNGVFTRLRREPGDDVLSALLTSHDGSDLEDRELFWMALMLLVAGNETTTNLIASMLYALAEDPEAYERLRTEPALIDAAVEEAIRWGSPIQGLYRTVKTDYTVGATSIPAGARVLLLFGAANRDPRRYPEPDAFRIDRHPTDHLGFGSGIHFCLGAQLARREARIVLEHLVDRVARIRLAGPPAWHDNPTVRGPRHLPLRLDAA